MAQQKHRHSGAISGGTCEDSVKVVKKIRVLIDEGSMTA
jgi:hypothetical protein